MKYHEQKQKKKKEEKKQRNIKYKNGILNQKLIFGFTRITISQ